MSRKCIVQALIFCCAIASAFGAEKTVVQAWGDEYQELLGQINRLKTTNPQFRKRLQAEALDPHSLVIASDKTPLDVVFRRTTALLEYFKTRQVLPVAALSDFELQLGRLSQEAR